MEVPHGKINANAKINKQIDKTGIAIRKFCLDDRNERSGILINFLYQHNPYLMSRFFQKKSI
jgi:hypothetical protein